jgi:putative heme iron utilization protein
MAKLQYFARPSQLYLSKHPNAFWVNFGDFNWFRLNVENVRFVGGFARAGDVSASDYTKSSPDPIVSVGGKVGKHMNDDHEEATLAMIEHYVGIKVESAKIVAMDSLGMDIVVERTPKGEGQPQSFKIRLPFEEPVKERKDIKEQIVKMTQASSKAA